MFFNMTIIRTLGVVGVTNFFNMPSKTFYPIQKVSCVRGAVRSITNSISQPGWKLEKKQDILNKFQLPGSARLEVVITVLVYNLE